MTLIYALLLLVAAGCFAYGAYRYSRGLQGKTLLAAGLLAWVLVPLFQTLQGLD
jgi:hypothetical protein